MSICGEGKIFVVEGDTAIVEVGPELIEVTLTDEKWAKDGMDVMLTYGTRGDGPYRYFILQEIKDYTKIYPKDQRYIYYKDKIDPIP